MSLSIPTTICNTFRCIPLIKFKVSNFLTATLISAVILDVVTPHIICTIPSFSIAPLYPCVFHHDYDPTLLLISPHNPINILQYDTIGYLRIFGGEFTTKCKIRPLKKVGDEVAVVSVSCILNNYLIENDIYAKILDHIFKACVSSLHAPYLGPIVFKNGHQRNIDMTITGKIIDLYGKPIECRLLLNTAFIFTGILRISLGKNRRKFDIEAEDIRILTYKKDIHTHQLLTLRQLE